VPVSRAAVTNSKPLCRRRHGAWSRESRLRPSRLAPPPRLRRRTARGGAILLSRNRLNASDPITAARLVRPTQHRVGHGQCVESQCKPRGRQRRCTVDASSACTRVADDGSLIGRAVASTMRSMSLGPSRPPRRRAAGANRRWRWFRRQRRYSGCEFPSARQSTRPRYRPAPPARHCQRDDSAGSIRCL
jgi:hypothetical protein